MLDSDIAELYQVPTKRLNEAVKRNRARFPDDFMFQLTPEETAAIDLWRAPQLLRSQNATSSSNPHGGRRYLPYAFTEHGVAMLSSVLSSDRAVAVNIAIVRTFLRLRRLLAAQEDLAQRFETLTRQVDQHTTDIHTLSSILEQLLEPPPPAARRIGFPD